MSHLAGQPLHMSEADRANYGGEAARLALYAGPLRKHFVTGHRMMVRIGAPRIEGEYIPSAEKLDTLFVHGGLEPLWMRRVLMGPSDCRVRAADTNWESALLSYPQNRKLEGIPDALMAGFVQTVNDQVSQVVAAGAGISVFDRADAASETKRYMEASFDDTTCLEVDQVLKKLQVSRIVVGHMPQRDHRAKTKCDRKYILADMMMSAGFADAGEEPRSFPGALVMTRAQDGTLARMAMHYVDVRGIRPNEDRIF